MITSQRIINFVAAEPFRPFRVVTAGGRSFDIRHPEMIQVGRTTMTIFLHMSGDPNAVKERQVEISLLLTESIEPLDTTTRPQGA